MEEFPNRFDWNGVEYARIPGWNNYYVNTDGEIVSVAKGRLTIMQTWTNQYGHRYCRLHEYGRRETISVHRAVAKAFLENKSDYPVVRHANDDPSDNRVDNLMWGTQKDNVDDCRSHGRMYMKPVYCLETGKLYSSCAEAAEEFGSTRSAITKACKDKACSVRGRHLIYANDI